MKKLDSIQALTYVMWGERLMYSNFQYFIFGHLGIDETPFIFINYLN